MNSGIQDAEDAKVRKERKRNTRKSFEISLAVFFAPFA